MEAGKRKLHDIFNQNRVLEIPFFQRSYVWQEDNWDRFLEDMKRISDEQRDYFLGSVILKQKETPATSQIGDWRVVVDGQQRLTTMTIFFKVLCRIKDIETDFVRTFVNRDEQVILQHNHNDIEIFEAIIEDKLTDTLRKDNANSSILQCHDFFQSKEDELKSIDYYTLTNRLYFVGIDLGRDEDEQQIFDTINSLGVSLTTAELLKNELFRREDEELFNKKWKFEFESDNKDYWSQEVTAGRQRRENIDLLLQAYLLLSSGAKDKYTRLDSLFKNYKVLLEDHGIRRGAPEHTRFIDGLVQSAALYRRNINPKLTEQQIDSSFSVERLNLIIFGLNTTTIVPYVVYLFREVSDVDEREQMLRLLESYLIRRFVCKETTKNYNNLFASFIRNQINSYEALREKIYNADNQTDLFPSDEKFRQGFFESNLTNQQAKTVLYLLEISLRDDNRESTTVRGLDQYSLEHVMPKKWRNNWGNIDDNEQARQRDQKLLKLGNLTIITSSLNSSIRDQSWELKKTGSKKKSGLAEYSRGIKIFDRDEYLHADNWSETTIDHRSAFLADEALKVWSI